ncbi:methyltransferase family protein [Terriglobus tenax]|uniref:methyltransferase family protein n=1 Tax=Terriglobus tenax TaxID=1111115 RepID=UPI0021E0289E|nr:isoprenylcysteine carboxylmethyltransferase family protein [Terriglobus tenax]
MKWLRATALEYRLRYLIHTVIYVVGFTAPWAKGWMNFGRQAVWVELSGGLMKGAGMGFAASTHLVLGLATLLAIAGAWLRTWGTAYIGAGVVQDGAMHGDRVLADGPYRYTRNPLYLGTILHTLAIAVLMQPLAALVVLVLITGFQFRLIFREEAFLTAQRGEAYTRYLAAVPRLFPSLRPGVAAGGASPVWGQAVLNEIYFLGVAASFLLLGWQWDAWLILRGILISLGASIVARAFLK